MVGELTRPYQRAIEIGAAGEHLVCADILLVGYRAYQAAQGLPYDVVADVGGQLIRIAVKATLAPRRRPHREASRICYQFSIGRSRRLNSGKTEQRAYTAADVDMIALVAPDVKKIAYFPICGCPTSIFIDLPGNAQSPRGRKLIPNRRFEDFGFARAMGIA